MTKKAIAQQFIDENPNVPMREMHHHLFKAHPDIFPTAKNAWSALETARGGKQQKPPESEPNGAISEGELISRYDIRSIVFAELAKLKAGEYWRDHDFARRFQGKGGFRAVLESSEAQKHRGRASGQTFWGHPDSITKMKERGVLI